MCVSKVQHVTGRKTGCNRSRPVFFGFSIFQQTLQLATEKIQNLCNRNWWSGLLQLGSVRFQSFFQSSELDLRTLLFITIDGNFKLKGKQRHLKDVELMPGWGAYVPEEGACRATQYIEQPLEQLELSQDCGILNVTKSLVLILF